MQNNIAKSISEKKDRETIQRQTILNELQESSKEFILPEIKKKATELSEYIEENIDKGKNGLTATSILPLIAKRSLTDQALAGHITFTPQELAIAFDIYVQVMSEINKYTSFPPSKQTFCLFTGITTQTYNNYLQDPEKCEIMRTIEDYITANKLVSAQLGELREISTMFELKSQHGWVEAQAPVVIEHKKETNVDDIKKKLAAIKGKVIDAEYEEKK
ncbi:MAG: hypothetical protein HFH45_03545 [Bacilli bacterium]|nr:hypothetical protein [Bacilli bacterium]